MINQYLNALGTSLEGITNMSLKAYLMSDEDLKEEIERTDNNNYRQILLNEYIDRIKK